MERHFDAYHTYSWAGCLILNSLSACRLSGIVGIMQVVIARGCSVVVIHQGWEREHLSSSFLEELATSQFVVLPP